MPPVIVDVPAGRVGIDGARAIIVAEGIAIDGHLARIAIGFFKRIADPQAILVPAIFFGSILRPPVTAAAVIRRDHTPMRDADAVAEGAPYLTGHDGVGDIVD